MIFSLSQILLVIIAYLTGLFAVAHLADRGIIPKRNYPSPRRLCPFSGCIRWSNGQQWRDRHGPTSSATTFYCTTSAWS